MNRKIIPLFIVVAIEILVLAVFSFWYEPYSENIDSSADVFWYSSDRIISSVELNSELIEWNKLNSQEQKRVSVSEPYAYSKIVIENSSKKTKTYFILNRDYNAVSNLMEIRKFQMFYIQSDYPFVNKSVYKVQVPPETTNVYFMEIQGLSAIAVSPVVENEDGFFNQMLKDQVFLRCLFIAIGFFAFYLAAEHFVLKNFSLMSAGIITLIIDLIYILQNGILFKRPVSVFFSENRFIVPAICIIFLIAEIFATVMFIVLFKSVSLSRITMYVSFVPWFIFAGIESVSRLLNTRVFYEQTVPMSFLVSVLTYGIFIVQAYNITQKEKQEELLSYFTLNSKVSFSELLKVKNIPTQILVKIRDRLQQPLEIIQAISAMMSNTTEHTKIVAYSAVISDYIFEMKKILGFEFGSADKDKLPSENFFKVQNDFEPNDFAKFKNSAICIYGKENETNLSIKVILNGEGFFCRLTDSYDEVVSGIGREDFQMLLIEPSNESDGGLECFDLCRKIREKHNMLQFPVLMIISFYANYLVRSGYSAGVNDFVIRPFDSAELVSRCYSLLRLKNIFAQNQELSRQENEKSAFLYFVTHNVNTPLTLLLNRLEELSEFEPKMNRSQKEIFGDVKDAANEINGIIQNVLISFRISDGRYVNVKEKLFVEDVLDIIRPTMETKASAKNIKIEWKIPEFLPQVFCNRQALRGIITNLVDNAIKYSPENANVKVQIELSQEKTNRDYSEKDDGFGKDDDSKAAKPEKMILSVLDEGEGVSSDKIPLLFTRFEKIGTDSKTDFSDGSTDGSAKKNTSVGLGLYVANELAKMNGIRLEYKDSESGGACFYMVFDLNKPFE